MYKHKNISEGAFLRTPFPTGWVQRDKADIRRNKCNYSATLNNICRLQRIGKEALIMPRAVPTRRGRATIVGPVSYGKPDKPDSPPSPPEGLRKPKDYPSHAMQVCPTCGNVTGKINKGARAKSISDALSK